MINKQGLLFLTLTSLILVLSVYYITMPNELLLTTNSSYNNKLPDKETNESDKTVDSIVDSTITETGTIEAMRNMLDDERISLTNELNEKLTKSDLTIEEKNDIYDELKYIEKIEGLEEILEQKIKEEFGLNSFVKIDNDVVEVVVQSATHDTNLAVKIMASVEEELESKMYISVSFKE